MENTETNSTAPVVDAIPAPVPEAPADQSSTVADTATPAVPAGPAITSTERIFATIGYVGPLFLASLVTQPKSTYCKFHARQSMGLFGLFFLSLIVLALVPIIGSLVNLGLFALYILCMYKAYSGEMWKVPFLGTIAQKIDFDSMINKVGSGIQNMNVVKEAGDKLTGALDSAVQTVTQQKPESAEAPAPAEPAAQATEAPAAPAAEPEKK